MPILPRYRKVGWLVGVFSTNTAISETKIQKDNTDCC